MGMLIDGQWNDEADRTMVSGAYKREPDGPISDIDPDRLRAALERPGRLVLVVSASCPWSHASLIALVLKGLAGRVALQKAGGPRIEGYGLLPGGSITQSLDVRHAHELYALTNPHYTGRASVPVLWDSEKQKILSNSSAEIIGAFDRAGRGADLFPGAIRAELDDLLAGIFDGLANAVYRAGLAERQDEYDEAVDTVFATMGRLEARLADRDFLFGDALTAADIRLFASLVRFDTVYATHFRCTRKRLVDHQALWRHTRRMYRMPGIRETVDFEQIRLGYYLNDGSHNPFGIVGQQPVIDWDDPTGLDV